MERRPLPGAPRRWPVLLVAGRLPSSPEVDAAGPSVRLNWQVAVAFSFMVLPLAAAVAAIALRQVLPAERAARACVDPAVTSCIRTSADALYWATTTLTTTGYGDLYPHTATGRGWAVALMFTGVLVVSGLFVTVLVTVLLRSGQREDRVLKAMRGEPEDEVRARLEVLKTLLRGLTEKEKAKFSPRPDDGQP